MTAQAAPETWERVDAYGDAIRAHQRDNGLIYVWDTSDACGATLPGARCQRQDDHRGDCSPEPSALDVLVLTPREARELAAWLLARTESFGGGS